MSTQPVGAPTTGIMFGAGQAITVSRPGEKPNPYNPGESVADWEAVTEFTVYGFIAVATWADNTSSDDARIIGDATLTVPMPEVDIRHGDKIVGPDGVAWRVEGHPRRNMSPFTGWQPTLEAALVAWEA